MTEFERFRVSEALLSISAGVVAFATGSPPPRQAQSADRRGRIFGSATASSKPSQQFHHLHLKRIGDGLECGQGHTLEASLQPVKVGTIQTGTMGKFFLAPAFLEAEGANAFAHGLFNVLQPSQD
jgi:hypothetical protein